MTQMHILIVAFFGVLVALSVIAMPYRRRLVDLCEQLQGAELSDDERALVRHLAATAYSWRAAIVISASFFSGLFQSGATIDRQYANFSQKMPVLATDPRSHELREAYIVSAVVTNPLFGVLALTFRLLFRVKARWQHTSKAARDVTDFVGSAATV